MQPRGRLTGAQVARWVLRNLAILMGAFLPTLLLIGAVIACAREPVGGAPPPSRS